MIGWTPLRLGSPIGTAVTVHNGSSGEADNLVTTYDSLTAPDGPGTMNDFDGEAISGNWKLTVSDNASFDTGTLNSWSLDVTTVGVCARGPSGQPGEVSPAGDASWHRAAGSVLQVVYIAGAASTGTTVYQGSAAAPISSLAWSAAHCNLGTSGSAPDDPLSAEEALSSSARSMTAATPPSTAGPPRTLSPQEPATACLIAEVKQTYRANDAGADEAPPP